MRRIKFTRVHGTSRHLSTVFVLIWMLILPRVALSGFTGEFPVTPLKDRATAFYTAWQNSDLKALKAMVCEEDSDAFSRSPIVPILSFRIVSIQFSQNGESAVIHTQVKRIFPMMNKPMDWILENTWVYQKNKWFLHYEQPKSPLLLLFGGSAGKGASNSKESASDSKESVSDSKDDKAKKENNPLTPNNASLIVFPETEYNFGNVAAVTELFHEFAFENQGKNPVRINRMSGSCSDPVKRQSCLIARADKMALSPGDKGKIDIQWKAPSLPQNVDQTLEVEFENGQFFFLHIVASVTPAAKEER